MSESISAFQKRIGSHICRHKNLADTLSKASEYSARVNRAVVKAATGCGCIRFEARTQNIPEDASLETLPQYMQTCTCGELCPRCRDRIGKELGGLFFYTAALAEALGINLDEVLLDELMRLTILGRFSLR